MPYANVSELRFCLKDCLDFCEARPQEDACALFRDQLARTLDNLERVLSKTDRYWADFMAERGDDKTSWKRLARALAATQKDLRRVDAIGFPSGKVLYWYQERLEQVAQEMIAYLEARHDSLNFASERIEALRTALDEAKSEGKESTLALREYNRFVGTRMDAISDCNHVIAGFRKALRRSLGKGDEAYQSIRWAQSVSPDKTVL